MSDRSSSSFETGPTFPADDDLFTLLLNGGAAEPVGAEVIEPASASPAEAGDSAPMAGAQSCPPQSRGVRIWVQRVGGLGEYRDLIPAGRGGHIPLANIPRSTGRLVQMHDEVTDFIASGRAKGPLGEPEHWADSPKTTLTSIPVWAVGATAAEIAQLAPVVGTDPGLLRHLAGPALEASTDQDTAQA